MHRDLTGRRRSSRRRWLRPREPLAAGPFPVADCGSALFPKQARTAQTDLLQDDHNHINNTCTPSFPSISSATALRMSLRILSASNVSKVTTRFTPDELVALMADVFSRLSRSDPGIVQPPRTTVPSGNHTCLFMPSRVASVGTTMKVVAVPTAMAPQDVKERGLPASTIVVDERSGGVKAIVNARNLTALRNAAGVSEHPCVLASFNNTPPSLLSLRNVIHAISCM